MHAQVNISTWQVLSECLLNEEEKSQKTKQSRQLAQTLLTQDASSLPCTVTLQ